MENQPQNNEKPVRVPAKAEHQVKIIVKKDAKELEELTNEFLSTISVERRLNGVVFAVNPKTGELIQVINYSNISPMTPEEWQEKQEVQKKFSKGFAPGNLMPNKADSEGPKVEQL